MLIILYPVFVHCYLDLVAKGYSDEGMYLFSYIISSHSIILAHKLMEQLSSDHTEFHEEELKRLKGITTPGMFPSYELFNLLLLFKAHVAENELSIMFRSNKFSVTLSAYSFELLLNFLHDSKFMLLLSIINQYLCIKVQQGR